MTDHEYIAAALALCGVAPDPLPEIEVTETTWTEYARARFAQAGRQRDQATDRSA